MAKLFNLAQMTTATLGQGTVTLVAAVAPFISFSAAGVIDGDVVAYSIIEGTNSEMGYGTYSSVGPTLTRNLRKSSTGALLVLAGSAIVRLSPGREDIINPDGSVAFAASLDMGSNKIITMADPSNPQDAATKNYVDGALLTGTHTPLSLGTPNGLSLVNQVLSLGLVTGTSAGALSFADWTTFNNKLAVTGSSTDNAIVRFDGTSSKLGQNSLATIDDSGNLNIPTGTTFNIGGVPHTHSGGAGALVLLEQHTVPATGTASLEFTSYYSSTYDEYQIEIIGICPATDGAELRIQVATTGTYDTGNNYAYAVLGFSNTGIGNRGSQATSFMGLHITSTGVFGSASMSVSIKMAISSGKYTRFHATGSIIADAGFPAEGLVASGAYLSVVIPTAFKIYASSGNLNNGIVRVYGIAKS